tara:strand:+ start:3811 stop:4008 length:198 start_codon:yes stop_codon:yes gene_type:complete
LSNIIIMNISADKIVLKCLEELAELSTVLLQDLNKDKDLTQKIVSEIKDVEKYLKLVKEIYGYKT